MVFTQHYAALLYAALLKGTGMGQELVLVQSVTPGLANSFANN